MDKISLTSHRKLTESNISFSFVGSIDVDIVDHVLAAVHSKLESEILSPGVKKRVYLVLVECLQNLCKQIDALNKTDRISTNLNTTSASFGIEGVNGHFDIATANYIQNEKIENLKNWLDEINSYDKAQLKQLYNKVLTNKSFSEQGGAGLGFIDIALKTGNKLVYDFESINEEFSYFTINVKINNEL